MPKPRRLLKFIALAVAVCVIAVVFASSIISKPADRVINGRHLSYWMSHTTVQYQRVDNGGFFLSDASGPLQSDVIAYSIHLLEKRDRLSVVVCDRLWRHLPEWLAKRAPAPDIDWPEQYNACASLGYFGTNARAAIPELTRAVNDTHYVWRGYAAVALSKIANGSDTAAVEALIKLVKGKKVIDDRELVNAIVRIAPMAAAKAGITNTPPPVRATQFD